MVDLDVLRNLPPGDVLSAAGVKVAILVGITWSYHRNLSPPNPSVLNLSAALNSQIPISDRLLLGSIPAVRKLGYVTAAYELYRGYTEEDWGVSPKMLAGLSVCLVGIRLRTQCYRQLGKRFTYDLRSHSRGGPGLVTTGPYSVVRHPSYVAAMITWAGFAIAYLDPRITKSIKFDTLSHQMNVGLYNLWHAALAVPCALFPILFVMRIRGEERILAQEFGPRWDQYARRVKWKLIPYIW